MTGDERVTQLKHPPYSTDLADNKTLDDDTDAVLPVITS
jgi:hypothetical protein